MANEPDVHSLVQQILESGRSVDDVCREWPALRPQVLEALHHVKAVGAELDAMFPSAGSAARAASSTLPSIPGYEVEAVLGHGGMGVVYRARHLKLDRPVAIKMLLSGVYASPAELERFRREAVAVARLHHPNIVQVHDVGDCEGRPFFTMELLEGGSLAAKFGSAPRPANEAATLLVTLAEAVHAAHGSGIVHRDLKPANVLLAMDGTPKIADFGLARTIDSEPGLTLTGARVGTPSYMAPEQALGRRDAIGPAVDVYALGAVLYEALTGRPPFRGETAAETERQVIAVTPAPPSRLNASVPRDLETVCLKCLNKEPARRYASAAELAADLGRFLRREPIVARRIGRVGRGLRWSQRHPAGAALLVLVVLLLMLGTGLVVEDRVLAAERHGNSERVRPNVDAVAGMISDDRDLPKAEAMLEQITGPLTPELQERVSVLQREVRLVKELVDIRLRRIAVVDGRFDQDANNERVEAEYERLFQDLGFAVGTEDAFAAAARIRSMTVRRQLVAALDDMAIWCPSQPRKDWISMTARHADPDPSGWRERFRHPMTFDHPQRSKQLADEVQVAGQPVQILVALAEELGMAQLDNVPFLRRVQHEYPGDFWVNWRLGEGLLKTQPEEAIRYLQAALAVRPRAAVVHLSLGNALGQGKRLHEARDCFLAAIRIDEKFATAYQDLGCACWKLGEHEHAQPAFETAVRLDPSNARSHFDFGCFLLQRGQAEPAVLQLQQAVHLAPKLAEYHQWHGKALAAANRPDEARVAYETMHRLADAGLRALLAQNRLDEALPALTRAAGMEPKSASSLCDLGDCLARLGRRDDAVVEFRSALVSEPGNRYAQERLLGLLVAVGRHDEATALCEQAVAERPEEPQAWDGYAELCLFLGRTDDYRRVCARVMERFGNATDPRACELAGRVSLLLPPETSVLQRAMDLIDRAIAAEPATRALGPMHPFHLTKALACYRAGRFDDAITATGRREFGDLGMAPMFVVAMASHRTGKTDPAWRMLGQAGLLFDWRPVRATDRLAWLMHLLRREAEAVIAPHLPDMLAGKKRAVEDEDRAILLAASSARNQIARAARLYAELLPSGSKMGLMARLSAYPAACMAVAASAGIGADAGNLDEALRKEYRSCARSWLATILTRQAREAAALPPEPRQRVADGWRLWTCDPELAAVREPAALELLPDAERREWRQLWDRVAALLAPPDAGSATAAPATTPEPPVERR